MNFSANLHIPVFINFFEALAIANFEVDRRVFGKDLAGRYIYMSDSFARDAGLPAPYLLGKTDDACAWANTADKCREDDARVLRDGTDTFRRESIRCANKTTLKVMLRKLVVRDATGSPIGIGGIYIPDRRLKIKSCHACADATKKALDSALALLNPEQMAHWEEQQEARSASTEDSFDQLELPE